MCPSSSLSRVVRRRAGVVSEKLAARGLAAFVCRKKLDRGLLPDIVSLRSERRHGHFVGRVSTELAVAGQDRARRLRGEPTKAQPGSVQEQGACGHTLSWSRAS